MEGKPSQDLLKLLPLLAGRRVVVVGDVFLDEYIVGTATRLSREAPIPVLEWKEQFYLPGGAANPARNIHALGGQAVLVAVIGDDNDAEELKTALVEAGIEARGVVVDASRPTTLKTRIVAQSSLLFPQQLARIDRVEREMVVGEVEQDLLKHLRELVPGADGVLVSDYRTGVATPAIVEEALELAHEHGKVAAVDSQGDLYKYRGYDLIKCNRGEAESALGVRLSTEADYRWAGQKLQADLGAGGIMITRGGEGMSVLGGHSDYTHLPAANRSEVYDVTGAGDTVIAVATLALASGIDLRDGARLANYAAGLVVRKLGNAVATCEELAWAIRNW